MSSPYPILENRPIDQWKVTELKEELKRRRLTTKGLKDDLIRRLDEALRVERENVERENAERENAEREKAERENAEREKAERENAERENIERENAERESAAKDADNGFNCDPQPLAVPRDAETVLVVTETAKDLVDHGGNENEKVDDVTVPPDINDSAAALGEEKVQEGDIIHDINSVRVEEESVLLSTTVETSITVTETTEITETVVSEVALGGQDSQHSGFQEGNVNLNTQLESEDSKPQLENEGLKTAHEDDKLDSSASENQVSEVSPNLGFQVKSDSISTDSVSINEKIELKDNIIADNVKLELDVVKPEMVEPSSSNVVPVDGESHPMDVEEPLEKKASVEEKDDKNATNADMNKNNDCADVGYSEKLNLDRSSGDDSMEEDVLESKQFDSKYNSDEVGDRNEKNEVPVVKEESPVDVVGDGLSTNNKDIPVENKSRPAVVVEKRKLHDQEAVGNNEPVKRQRRWNSESLKVPEPQSSNITPTTTPRDAFQSTALKRNFSRSDSTASEDAPKERVVPPSQKPTTNSLRIDRFLRPFTLKAVQELLGKTGTITSFWMDHIKTHCYVSYSSVEEAVETRNAVYNLQWPPNGGRLLVAEFVDPQEVKMRLETPHQAPVTPVGTGSSAAPAPSPSPKQPLPSPRQQVSRQQLPPPPTLPPPPPLSNPPPARERLPLPPAPPLTEKVDPPIVTLDDLFRKTKATPRIYYLPLSEEQVASKLAARGKNTKQ